MFELDSVVFIKTNFNRFRTGVKMNHRTFYRKGIRLKFLNQDVDNMRQRKRSQRRLEWPRKEFSFLFNNCSSLESAQPEIGTSQLEKHPTCGVSGAPFWPLENLWEIIIRTPDRTESASGLQGQQPLVTRGRQVREVGNLGP